MCAGDSKFLVDEIIKNQVLLVAMTLLAGISSGDLYTRDDFDLKTLTES